MTKFVCTGALAAVLAFGGGAVMASGVGASKVANDIAVECIALTHGRAYATAKILGDYRIVNLAETVGKIKVESMPEEDAAYVQEHMQVAISREKLRVGPMKSDAKNYLLRSNDAWYNHHCRRK